MTKEEHELEFLRFFYHEADVGPADSDVRTIIMEDYQETTGHDLPEGYKWEE